MTGRSRTPPAPRSARRVPRAGTPWRGRRSVCSVPQAPSRPVAGTIACHVCRGPTAQLRVQPCALHVRRAVSRPRQAPPRVAPARGQNNRKFDDSGAPLVATNYHCDMYVRSTPRLTNDIPFIQIKCLAPCILSRKNL